MAYNVFGGTLNLTQPTNHLCVVYSSWITAHWFLICHSPLGDSLTRTVSNTSTLQLWRGTIWSTWRVGNLGPTRRWASPNNSDTSCWQTLQPTSLRWNTLYSWGTPTVSWWLLTDSNSYDNDDNDDDNDDPNFHQPRMRYYVSASKWCFQSVTEGSHSA